MERRVYSTTDSRDRKYQAYTTVPAASKGKAKLKPNSNPHSGPNPDSIPKSCATLSS